MTPASGALTAEVKDVAKAQGAVLVGVANVERFEASPPFRDAPPTGHRPADFLPGARSVVSIAIPVLDPVMDAPARLADQDLEMIPAHVRRPYLEALYNRVGHVLHDNLLEAIAQHVGMRLLAHGFQAMIFPTTGLHPGVPGMTDEQIWEGVPGKPGSPFGFTFGPFSHRHAAVRAGLGEFGYSNVVLTRAFGPRQRFNSIVTDAPLAPDPLVTEPICLRDKCRLCLDACSMQCIRLRDDPSVRDYRSLLSDDRTRIFLDTPAMTFPKLCRRRREGRTDPPVRGDCIRVCPVP
ncbi:MAG: hypothetical protein AAB215_05745, partial [Planctomycetota bacterium]